MSSLFIFLLYVPLTAVVCRKNPFSLLNILKLFINDMTKYIWDFLWNVVPRTYLLREWGILMGNCPEGQPWEENHLWTASMTSRWNIPSSESSSGNMADPSDRDARSCWLRLMAWSEPDGGLFIAPSRFTGVLPSVESVIGVTKILCIIYFVLCKRNDFLSMLKQVHSMTFYVWASLFLSWRYKNDLQVTVVIWQ